jgi:hypothetical protein
MLPLILAFLVTERVVTPGWYKHSGVGTWERAEGEGGEAHET